MPHRFIPHFDILSVIFAHLVAVSVTLTDVEMSLKIISLLLAMGYTVWRWLNDYSKAKKGLK